MPRAEYHMQETSSRNTKSTYNRFLSGITPQRNYIFCHRMDIQFLLKCKNSMHHHFIFILKLNGYPSLKHSNIYFSFCKDHLSVTNVKLKLRGLHSRISDLTKVDSFVCKCR